MSSSRGRNPGWPLVFACFRPCFRPLFPPSASRQSDWRCSREGGSSRVSRVESIQATKFPCDKRRFFGKHSQRDFFCPVVFGVTLAIATEIIETEPVDRVLD